MGKVNKHNIVEHLITYELGMIGKDFSETKKDKWYSINKITEDQHKTFEAYSLPLIRKVYRCSKERAQKEFMWFDLAYGLSVISNGADE
jgi:hypothetical protein